jgi:chorismate synthase
LEKPLESVELKTLRSAPAARQRSDVCFVPAASCVLENVAAFELAGAVVEKFGGDSLAEIQARWRLFHELARETMPIRL